MTDKENYDGQTRLESWKEIAAHIQRDVRTARRWELEEGLPIHRHPHKSRSSVFAYPGELDAWRAARTIPAEPPAMPWWRRRFAVTQSLAFGTTIALCLVMAGNGLRPQTASAQGGGDAKQMRQIWSLPTNGEIFGPVSRDGRYIAYVAWAQKGNLFLHDLAAGSDRGLTDTATNGSGPTEEYAEETAFSRDGKQLAYSWFVGKNDRYELRIVQLDGSGMPTVRRLLDNPDVDWIAPRDWSPDGRSIAVNLSRKDHTLQIGSVAVESGSLRVLKSIPWNGLPGQMFFSPEGRYLAYSLRDPGTIPQQDLYVMSVDGSREIPAVLHQGQNLMEGWSPDGKLLLYSTDRGGDHSLWGLPMADGKPAGAPRLLSSGLAQREGFGLAANGTLYMSEFNPRASLQMVEMDPATGRFLAPPQPALPGFTGNAVAPTFSPDGKRLAYGVRHGSGTGSLWMIGTRDLETGESREIATTPGLDQFRTLSWAPDGASFVATGRDIKAGQGVFRVDARTGATQLIVSGMQYRGVSFAPDGKSLDMVKRDAKQPQGSVSYVRWNLAAGTETLLDRRDATNQNQKGALGGMRLSPDGRYIATLAVDAAAASRMVLLIPTSGGDPRALMRVPGQADAKQPGNFVFPLGWAPDSSAIYIRKRLAGDLSQDDQIWRAALDGSAPTLVEQKLSRDISNIEISPNGRRVVFQVANPPPPTGVWTLENFLPREIAAK